MALSTNINHSSSEWKSYEKIALRFFFIYFAVQIFPIIIKLFTTNWLNFNFFDLFSLTHYTPTFFSLSGYSNWLFAFIVALIATFIWVKFEPKDLDNDNLYYWLRVILRYRLALGIIGFGFIKLFPLQLPYPSLSNLHTNYGDFAAWKIYFHTVGITQGYESFLGLVEVFAGGLLFFRKTVTFGTGIIIGFTGNVLAANFAYNADEQVYSSFLVLIAFFLFAYDIPRLFSLLALERRAIANKFQPVFTEKWLANARLALKGAFIFFVVLYGVKTYGNYINEPYKLPKIAGLKGTYGYYNVKEFKFNNDTIPYSTIDPNRWQNVIFEKWATVSIKIAKPVTIDNTLGEGYFENDIDRNYESAGVDGRHYYAFKADTTKHTLFLENKNKNHKGETFTLNYSFQKDSTIVLRGVNERKDSVYAVLDKINKKYMLFEGRRKPIKL